MNPNLKRRISPWIETSQRSEYSRDSKLQTQNKNPPIPTSDQIDSLIPTIAETGRIKYKFQKKKKKFRNKEKIANFDEVVQIPQSLRSGFNTVERKNTVRVRIPQRTNTSPTHHLNNQETSQTPIR